MKILIIMIKYYVNTGSKFSLGREGRGMVFSHQTGYIDNNVQNELLSISGVLSNNRILSENITNVKPDMLAQGQDDKSSSFGELGVYLTNGSAYTLGVNHAYEALTEIMEEEVLGHHMQALEERGLFDHSVTLLVLKYRTRITIEQKILRTEKKFIVTGNPVFNHEGDIVMVATTVRPWYDRDAPVEKLAVRPSALPALDGVVATSKTMQRVLLRAARVAATDSTVLLLGETGVGKEVVAKVIHQLSHRQNRPFNKVNVPSIPEELFESELFGYRGGSFTGALKTGKIGMVQATDGGTLFLDEIGEVPLGIQVKLLRLLQEKEITPVGSTSARQVDVRFLAATNRNLLELVKSGQFREDLFYRLNVVQIYIPPLRERPEDICTLAQYFLTKLCHSYKTTKRLTPSAMQVLRDYSWPGNIREVRNIMERLVIFYPQREITKEQVLEELTLKSPYPDKKPLPSLNCNLQKAMADFERDLIEQVLRQHDGNVEKAAETLSIHRTTLSRKVHKYNLRVK